MITKLRLFIPLLLAFVVSAVSATEIAGALVSTEGTVFVTRADGKKRIVAPGSNLFKGDTIQTEQASTARLRFSDGSEIVIRPGSSMVVQDYKFLENSPQQDSFVLGLLRGGMRQISGLIGKRGNQDAYQLKSATATIGIRGTDFTARVCQTNECQDNAKSSKAIAAGSSLLVGKLVESKGRVSALQTNGLRRDLTEDGSVYVNDLIEVETGGHAAILFRDETRVVVPGDSAFRVANYRYVANQAGKNNMMFDVTKGAFRMITGLIGKQSPQNVGVRATTATIGIRGTSFDLACVPTGIAGAESYTGGGAVCGGGLLTSTRDGTITVTTDDGNTSIFSAGQSSYIAGPNQTPIILHIAPAFFNALPGPIPERIKIDIPGVFGVDGAEISETGLFVTVSDGRVVVVQADRELFLSAGESGFASSINAMLLRLNDTPGFLREDQGATEQSFGFKSCRM